MELSKINSLVELFFTKYNELNSTSNKPFLKWLKDNKKDFLTWKQVERNIQILSEYLRKNLSKGDRCILLSENRPEWLISDIAIMNAGGVTVPLFTTYSEKDYEYIINDCNPKICIVSNNTQLKKIDKFISDNIKVLSIENIDKQIDSIENIFERFSKDKTLDHYNFNQNIERKDLACIIYTSGTTGNPKGVMLSHGGILSNCEGAQEILNSLVKDSEPVFLTWLPLSHSYEHAVQFVQITLGAKIYYAESLEKLLPNMAIAKPTIMTAVPRFYQNLYSKISMNFSKQKGFKKKMISSTISIGTKKLNSENLTLKEKYKCKIIGFIDDKKRIPGIDICLKNEEIFKEGDFQFKTYHTPGHTLGHICYHFFNDKILFTGDTLFSLSCGRLFEGTYEDMFRSLSLIKTFDKETLIYCGHEYTLKNSDFCLKYDTENSALISKIQLIKNQLAKGQPTIPTTLQEELQTNIFLRSKNVENFSKLRELKDNF